MVYINYNYMNINIKHVIGLLLMAGLTIFISNVGTCQ